MKRASIRFQRTMYRHEMELIDVERSRAFMKAVAGHSSFNGICVFCDLPYQYRTYKQNIKFWECVERLGFDRKDFKHIVCYERRVETYEIRPEALMENGKLVGVEISEIQPQ